MALTMKMMKKLQGFGKRGFIVAVAAMLMGCGLCSCGGNKKAEAQRIEEESIAAIKKLGGEFFGLGSKPHKNVRFPPESTDASGRPTLI